jgi:hypothetical protein
MIRVTSIALAALVAVPAVASAYTIEDRKAIQSYKIEQGRKDGSITWREGLKLRSEQRKIERTEAALKEKGYLTKRDRRELSQMQSNAAKHIYAEKNDRWYRAWFLPRVGR